MLLKDYIKSIDEIKSINNAMKLNPYEIELLNSLANAHILKKKISIRKLIGQRAIASPVTLSNALKNLIKKNLITTVTSKDDGRVREVALTKLGLGYFKNIVMALRSAMHN